MTEKPELKTHINPISQKKHQNQLLWQIILPLAIVVGIVLIIAVLIGYAGQEDVSKWADISVIFLVIHVIVVVLILLLIIGLGIFGMQKVTKLIPKYTYQAQEIFSLVAKNSRRLSDGTTQPFMRIAGVSAALKTLIRSFRMSERR